MDWRILVLIGVMIFVAHKCWGSLDKDKNDPSRVSIYKEIPKPGAA